jgi:hypothetical protein
MLWIRSVFWTPSTSFGRTWQLRQKQERQPSAELHVHRHFKQDTQTAEGREPRQVPLLLAGHVSEHVEEEV